jgi:hypothetical protein
MSHADTTTTADVLWLESSILYYKGIPADGSRKIIVLRVIKSFKTIRIPVRVLTP